MASGLFRFSATRLQAPLIGLGLGLGATACIRQQFGYNRPLRLDSGASSLFGSRPLSTRDVKSEVQRRRLNPRVVRQISTGSILGVLAGLGVSIFSKPLAILLGLLIVGVQTAESYGIHIVPRNSIQRYVKNIDIKSTLQENVPFKISFGILFALTGFAEFSGGV